MKNTTRVLAFLIFWLGLGPVWGQQKESRPAWMKAIQGRILPPVSGSSLRTGPFLGQRTVYVFSRFSNYGPSLSHYIGEIQVNDAGHPVKVTVLGASSSDTVAVDRYFYVDDTTLVEKSTKHAAYYSQNWKYDPITRRCVSYQEYRGGVFYFGYVWKRYPGIDSVFQTEKNSWLGRVDTTDRIVRFRSTSGLIIRDSSIDRGLVARHLYDINDRLIASENRWDTTRFYQRNDTLFSVGSAFNNTTSTVYRFPAGDIKMDVENSPIFYGQVLNTPTLYSDYAHSRRLGSLWLTPCSLWGLDKRGCAID